MQISAVQNYITSFKAQTNPKQEGNKSTNPVSKTGEKSKLVTATFIAGLGLGAKLLFEILDGDFVVDELSKGTDKILEKNHKNVKGGKRALYGAGIFGGLVMMFIGGVAMLYTLFKAPKINYEGNINAHKHSKDMDVYIKSNEAERELYTQMNDKAKNATPDEKAKLQEQYMQMQMAKNQIPQFVKDMK